jgi:hypothetical protein
VETPNVLIQGLPGFLQLLQARTLLIRAPSCTSVVFNLGHTYPPVLHEHILAGMLKLVAGYVKLENFKLYRKNGVF